MNPSISITSRLPWQATALLVAALALAPASRALVFELGDIKANFDTTLSVGGLLRMDNPSRDLIGLASGRFSLGQVAVPVGVGIGVGTGVPIVTSVVTAVI